MLLRHPETRFCIGLAFFCPWSRALRRAQPQATPPADFARSCVRCPKASNCSRSLPKIVDRLRSRRPSGPARFTSQPVDTSGAGHPHQQTGMSALRASLRASCCFRTGTDLNGCGRCCSGCRPSASEPRLHRCSGGSVPRLTCYCSAKVFGASTVPALAPPVGKRTLP